MNSGLPSPTLIHDNDDSDTVPDGYTPFERGGPWFRTLGPLYARPDGHGGMVLALRIGEKHANTLGIAHGGMLVTLADGAMGINLSLRRPATRAAQSTVTATLTSEFLSAARVGDWLEAHVHIRRNGRRIVFAECTLKVGEREVLHAGGTFLPVEG